MLISQCKRSIIYVNHLDTCNALDNLNFETCNAFNILYAYGQTIKVKLQIFFFFFGKVKLQVFFNSNYQLKSDVLEERWRKRYSSSSNIHKINCSLLQLLNTKNRVNICTCSLILDYKISDMPSSKEKNSLNPSLRSERFAFSNLSFKVQKPRVVYFPLQCNSESFWCSTTSIKITQKNKNSESHATATTTTLYLKCTDKQRLLRKCQQISMYKKRLNFTH